MGVIGLTAALAVLYRATQSILLCVAVHAMVNTVGEMGLTIPADQATGGRIDAALQLAVGLAMLSAEAIRGARSDERRPAGP